MDVYEPIPQYSGLVNLAIFVPGAAATTLGVIAEHRRTKNVDVKFTIPEGGTSFVCLYPDSLTMPLSMAAVGLVVLGYCIATLFSGVPFVGKYGWVSGWQKFCVHLNFFFNLALIGCTIGLFVGAAVAEVRHESKPGDLDAVFDEASGQLMGVNPMTGGPNCRNGKEGLTGGAALLAFCLIVTEIMYYQLMLFAKGFYANLVVVDDHKVAAAVADPNDSSSVRW